MTQEIDLIKEQDPQRKPLVYRNFNLHIGDYLEVGGTFKVWVEDETLGRTRRHDVATERTYDASAFWPDPNTATGGLLGRLKRRMLTRIELFSLGSLPADLILPEGQVRDLFRQSIAALKTGEGLRLRLHIDPFALAQLPWELPALSQASVDTQASDFLALRREISIVRTEALENAAYRPPDREMIHVMGVFSSPIGKFEEVESDRAAYLKAMEILFQAAGKQLIYASSYGGSSATRALLEQALSSGADIFFFVGQAAFDLAGKENQILLEGKGNASDNYSSEQLARLLHNAGVRLALVNTWQSSPQAGIALLRSLYQTSELENQDWSIPLLYLHDGSGMLYPRLVDSTPGRTISESFLQVSNTLDRVLPDRLVFGM